MWTYRALCLSLVYSIQEWTYPERSPMTTEQKTNTRTLRLKLKIRDDESREKRKYINQLSDATYKAANRVVDAQRINDELIEHIYKSNKLDRNVEKDKIRAEEIFKEFMRTKRKANSQSIINAEFPIIPPCVANPLANTIYSAYTKNRSKVKYGLQSTACYKKGMPFDLTADSVVIKEVTDIVQVPNEKNPDVYETKKIKKHVVTLRNIITKGQHISFTIIYGKDKGGFRETIKGVIEGKYKSGASRIKLKDNDIYLQLTVQQPVQGLALNPDIIVGVDLGMIIPAYAALNNSPERKALGSFDEFGRVRTQMRVRKRTIQKNSILARSQHGRKRKMKALEKVATLERNFANTYNHMISKKIVDFAIHNNAGVIQLELLEGIARDEKSKFVLSNWSYYELQTMIIYKAKTAGIETRFIDPYHTSQTCSKCGHYEEKQREVQSLFKCAKCGAKFNADYNAARNIAKSDKIVTAKEECYVNFVNKIEKNKKYLVKTKDKAKWVQRNAEYLMGADDLKKATRTSLINSKAIELAKQDKEWNDNTGTLDDIQQILLEASNAKSIKTFKKKIEKMLP